MKAIFLWQAQNRQYLIWAPWSLPVWLISSVNWCTIWSAC